MQNRRKRNQKSGFDFAKWIIQSKIKWRHPVYLVHALTAKCNARCGFCAWHPDFYDSSDELSTDEVKTLYSDAKRAGFFGVSVWGGEPLVRGDVGEVLEHAHGLGLTTNMVTNGALLQRKMDAVAPYLDRIAISVDHASDKHDEQRNIPGLFGKITDATRAMKSKYPHARIVFNCTLQQSNVDWRSIDALVNTARSLGVAVLFNPMRIEPASDEAEQTALAIYNPTDAALKEAYAFIRDLKKRGAPIVNSDSYMEETMNLPLEYRCHWPKFIMPIEANGDVVDCMHWGTRPIDNIRSRPFSEILDNPRLRVLGGVGGENCHKCVSTHRWEVSEVWEGRLSPLWSWGKTMIWNRALTPELTASSMT